MDDYDEDLTENEFFIEFKKRCPTIFATLPEKKWILCIPKRGSFNASYFTDVSFFSHVIVPLERDDEGERATLLKTLRNQHLTIEKRMILTGNGFRKSKKVPILFDETFFGESTESHVLYCISEPLEKAYNYDDEMEEDEELEEDGEDAREQDDLTRSLTNGYTVALNSIEDCKLLLWGHSDNLSLQEQMNVYLENFCRDYLVDPDSTRPPGEFNLEQCVVDLRDLYDNCLRHAHKDHFLSQVIVSNPSLEESISVATEAYCLHSVYPVLWPILEDYCAHDDARLNRNVRRLRRCYSQSIGVPRDFLDRIPRARREFAQIDRATTPWAKNLCIRRVTRHLARVSEMKYLANEDTTPVRSERHHSVLTTDELLPILVFLIVKSNVRTWHAQLTLMRHFRLGLSRDDADEFSYYCTTLEAAMEHILGNLDCDHMAESEDPACLRIRSDSNPTPRSVDAFLQLVDDGDVTSVASLLSKSSDVVLSARQCHPLCRCADCEKALMERSRVIGVHCYNDQGHTALHIACIRGHLQVLDLLIELGASVNVVDGQGWSGLHFACMFGHQDSVLLLLDAKADINAPDNEGNAPLHLCADRDYQDCVKALAYHGSNKSVLNIDAVNMAGDTALHLAARYGYEGMCEILLDCGASLNMKNRKGQRPSDGALNPRLRQQMLRRLAMPLGIHGVTVMPDASTPLSNMVESGIEIAPSVSTSARTPTISSCTTLPITTGVSTTGFASRSTSRSSGFVDGTVTGNMHSSAFGSLSDASNCETSSTLRRVEKMLKAAGDGDLPMVRHYLGIQEDDDNEEVPLNGGSSEMSLCHPLCQCDKCLPIQKRILGSNGTEIHVNSANQDGFTCLHVVSIHGHLSLAKFLLRRGADPSRRTRNLNLSPLHQASQYGWPELVTVLLQFGADLNAQDASGNTPLYYASSNGRQICAQRLLEAGAKTMTPNLRGNTPLHEAARGSHSNVLKVLLVYGAKPQARNKQQLTPLQFAANQEIRDLLVKANLGGSGRRSTGPTWNSERKVKSQHPTTLSLFDDDEELEVAEEVFAHRPLFEDDEASVDPSVVSETHHPDCSSEAESSPYRSAVIDSLTSTTPENAYRLDFNSLESSPESKKESRREAVTAASL